MFAYITCALSKTTCHTQLKFCYNAVMKIIAILVGAGLATLVAGFLCKLLYVKLLRKLPRTAVRLGKAWGQTTDRYAILRSLNTFFYLVGMAVTLAGVGVGVVYIARLHTAPPTPVVITTQTDDTLSAKDVLRLVNVERKGHNLNQLKEDTRLTAIAQERVDDMIKNQYYAHLSPEGKYYYDLFPQQRIKANYSCENLDVEFTTDESVYVNDWLASTKGHRECMLNPDVTSAGYAVGLFGQSGSTKVYLVVAVHSSPISAIPAPEQPLPGTTPVEQ